MFRNLKVSQKMLKILQEFEIAGNSPYPTVARYHAPVERVHEGPVLVHDEEDDPNQKHPNEGAGEQTMRTRIVRSHQWGSLFCSSSVSSQRSVWVIPTPSIPAPAWH